MIWYGDCLEIMPLMDKRYDLILTDPPYGINYKSNRSKNPNYYAKHGIVGDVENDVLLCKSIEHSYSLLKDNSHIYWFTSWSTLPTHMVYLKRFYKIKNVLIWDKASWSMGDLHGAYANQYECIIFGVKGKRKLNPIGGTMRHPDILRYPRVRSNYHPHEKPVGLLEFLIQKSTNEGDWVLDFFAGTGSTGVACTNTKRNFTGIEINKEYATWQL